VFGSLSDPDGGIICMGVADGGVWGGNPPTPGELEPLK